MTNRGSAVSPHPASSTSAWSSSPGVLARQRGIDTSRDNRRPAVATGDCVHGEDGTKPTDINTSACLEHSERFPNSTDSVATAEGRVIDTTQRCSGDSMTVTPRRPSSSLESSSNRRTRKETHRSLRPRSGGMTPWGGRGGAPTFAGEGGLYGRSIKSCARHLRLSSDSDENNDKSQPEAKPTSLISFTTMSTPTTVTKGGGIALEFLAFRDKFTEVAVRQAKAQVLLANHAVREPHDGHTGVPRPLALNSVLGV